VWDQDEQGNWYMTGSWKAHSGSVWKVTWAHPEFGQVVATCSFDRTACVWEEIVYSYWLKGKGENHFGKTTLNTPDRDSNLDVPIIGSIVYCEGSALDHAAMEMGLLIFAPDLPRKINAPYMRVQHSRKEEPILPREAGQGGGEVWRGVSVVQ
ncbi:unnamed protein product, partial [Timema podura]|nr:unnamed protein product [Timema podura]